MLRTSVAKKTLAIAVLAFAMLSMSFAQTAPTAGTFDVPAIVKDLGLPADKAESAGKLINDLIGQVQDSTKSLIALLGQKKPEQLLDPQVSQKIVQVQKSFTLKFEKFQLDLADIAPQAKVDVAVARIRESVPKILFDNSTPAVAQMAAMPSTNITVAPAAKKPAEVPLGSAPVGMAMPAAAPAASSLDLSMSTDPAATSGGMGMMEDDKMPMPMDAGMMPMMEDDKMPMPMDGGMMGMDKMPMPMDGGMMDMGMAQGASAQAMGTSMAPAAGASSSMNDQLLKQVQATNALIQQMVSSLATQTGAAAQAQMQLLGQLLANQNATIQLILNNPATQPMAAPAGAMPMGSSGMSMM